MILTYIRKAYTSQVQFNNKVSLMNVDLLSNYKDYITVQEVLSKCYYELNDKGVASLRFKGYTKAEICIGHFEIQGFKVTSTMTQPTGINRALFQKFDFYNQSNF